MNKSHKEVTELIKSIDKQLFAYAYSLTKHKQDAEDLKQDTLVKVFTKFHTYKMGTDFKHWSFIIMKNHFIDGVRKKKLDCIEKSSNTSFSFYESLSTTTIQNECFETFKQEEFNRKLSALKNKDIRRTVELRMASYKEREIAKIMNVAEGTVKSRYSRAKKILSKTLKQTA